MVNLKEYSALLSRNDRDLEGRQGLQAMWEARWRLRGVPGCIEWKACHGEWPATLCPLLAGQEPSPRGELAYCPV
ncbi:MAG TPA: hypothetical protein VK188_09305 [Holophaga sp.]|nr:hypothetical protein [Holophaga sp.]